MQVLAWIADFLYNGKQCVVLNSEHSSCRLYKTTNYKTTKKAFIKNI